MTYPEDPGFVAGSKTSQEGAEHALKFAKTQREKVFLYILSRGPLGATDEETTIALKLRKASQTARRCELDQNSEVFDSGYERDSTAQVGNVVWVASRDWIKPGYVRPPRGTKAGPKVLRKALLMAGPYCQGAGSGREAGAMIAAIFDIDFPLTMAGLEVAALREGYKPRELWPWFWRKSDGV